MAIIYAGASFGIEEKSVAGLQNRKR